MDDIKKIMADCKSHKIKVLNPDVNESSAHFTVNKSGDIRFGLSGIKGFGGNITDAILKERSERGPFADVFDFMERMSGIVNRKNMEALVNAGAFDSMGVKRTQFNLPGKSSNLFIDELMSYGEKFKACQEDEGSSLFGEVEELKPMRPEIPALDTEEDQMEILRKEKDLVGMYLSSHPLDKYRFEIENFTNESLANLKELIPTCESSGINMKIAVAGIITSYTQLVTKTGRPYSRTVIEDYNGSYELSLFGKDHERFAPRLQAEHSAVYITGEIAPKFFSRSDDGSRQPVPYGLKVNDIRLLGNIADEFVSFLALYITTDMLNSSFRKDLVSVVSHCKGNVPLHMFLYDAKSGYNIEFNSRKFHIAASADFIQRITDMKIPYKVFTKQQG